MHEESVMSEADVATSDSTEWWFNSEMRKVERRAEGWRFTGNVMRRVTKEYAKYLSTVPEGEWELRMVKKGDVIVPMHIDEELDEGNIALSDFIDLGCDDRGYRWCKARPVLQQWWFCTRTKDVGWAPKRLPCPDCLEVTAAYAEYLSKKPAGAWELRIPKRGDTVMGYIVKGEQVAVEDYVCDGCYDIGYRWCKIIPVKSAVVINMVPGTTYKLVMGECEFNVSCAKKDVE